MPTLGILNDNELGSLVKTGNILAFTEIYNRYGDELLRSANRILKDRDASMDVVQEVFVWYWTRREELVLSSIKAYLLIAVKYQVANYLRREVVKRKYVNEIELSQLTGSYDHSLIELKEFSALLTHFTSQLPNRCREVFELSRQQHLSNKEIANKLGISEKTVEMQITIAIKRLRLSLSKYSAFLFFFF